MAKAKSNYYDTQNPARVTGTKKNPARSDKKRGGKNGAKNAKIGRFMYSKKRNRHLPKKSTGTDIFDKTGTGDFYYTREQTREHFCSRDSWNCSRNEFSRVLTKRVFTKRVFLVCSRNECSRNEFSWSAHETSAHETSFVGLLTKRVLTKRVLTIFFSRVLTKRVANSWANQVFYVIGRVLKNLPKLFLNILECGFYPPFLPAGRWRVVSLHAKLP